jgi:hemolysin III
MYSAKEEIANTVTHALGALLSLNGLIFLVVFSTLNGNGYHIVSSAVFGASLIILYSMSTFYHLVKTAKLKKLFRALDHSSIFILIAGTYTPFTLVTLQGGWGWTLFGMVWGLAIAGIILETVTGQRFEKLSLGLYIAMGWLIVIAAKPLLLSIAPGGLALLVGGGLCYTFGVIFYIWNSLVFNHAIWHIFVLSGSALHFFAVFFYVIP